VPVSIRSAAATPLWLQAVLLCVVVATLIALTNPGYGFSSDEGASMGEARALADGSWTYDYPLSWLERAEAARPFVRGDVGERGVAPYAKHPLYPLALRAVGAGTFGAYALSVAGTALAALAAAGIARRLRAGRVSVVASLWLTGLATPLLVDAGMLLAHTMAAALVGACGVLTLVASAPESSRRWWVAAAGAFGAAALASGLRTEAALAVLALAAAVLVVRRSGRAATTAGALAGGVVAARAIDALAIRAIVGTPRPTPPNTVTAGVQGRWEGFYTTWLQTSYFPRTGAGTLLWVALLALAGAAVLFRKGRIGSTGFAVVAVAATAAFTVRMLVDPVGAIPGLLPTIPVLWALAWFVSPRGRGQAWTTMALASVLGVASILATQYSIGGGVEWGGRYFAVLLPVAVAVVVTGAASNVGGLRAASTSGRVALVTAVTTSVFVGVMGLATLRTAHDDAEALAERISAADAASGGIRPIVVTPNRLLPQLLHPDLQRWDWVAADGPDLAGFTSQLADHTDRLVFVAPAADQWLDDQVLARWAIRTVDDSAAYDVVVLERNDDD
jgi:hypothetical protein